MPFTRRALERVSFIATVERGQGYYDEGRVHDLAFAFPSSRSVRATATVVGTTRYRTSLEIDTVDDEVTYLSCTCPYERNDACKHVVAVGLAAIGELARTAHTHVVQARPSLFEPLQPLDEIRLAVSYDAERDALIIKPEAVYGPHVLRLLADAGEAATEIERDIESERQCVRDMDRLFPVGVDAHGRWQAFGGDDIYRFVAYEAPSLAGLYEVVPDDSARPLFDVESAAVDTEWNVSLGGDRIGYMDFAVEMHCANAGITPTQLEKMLAEGRSWLRRKDGSFVKPENLDEAEQALEFLRGAKRDKDGRYAVELARAPEMIELLRVAPHARKLEMDARIAAFLDEAQTGRPVEPVTIPPTLAGVLRPYQVRGVEWMMFLASHGFGGILADDMGLGKTLQVIALLLTDAAAGAGAAPHGSDAAPRKPSLVVCPKTLVGIWAAEAAKFAPSLRVLCVEGTAEERAALLDRAAEHDLVVTSYPSLLRDVALYGARDLSFRHCVLDEAQYVKNGRTASAKAVKMVRADLRLALSGTPLENGVHELWSIFDFLMPGFLGDARDFRRRFEKPIHERRDPEALRRLQAKIRPFVLRRTKASEAAELPAKIEQTRECALTAEQVALYAELLAAARREVEETVARKGFARSRIEILAALLRLRQCCNHPALIDKSADHDPDLSGKMPHALEIIDEAVAGGHKVLLFSAFTSMLDIIRPALDARGIGHVTIEGKTRDRDAVIRKFNDDPSTQVFLLSLKAGGVGLTLTAADTVILFDPWWNPMAENQAMDRAHRIGQTKTVNVYKLITKGTIEDRVLELQGRKRALFEALMTENGEGLEALTWEDVRGLFG